MNLSCILMRKDVKEKYPEHCDNKENIPYKLIMSNDFDGLFSAILMTMIKGYPIKFFYTYNKLYAHESVDLSTFDKNQLLGVDLDFCYSWEDGTWIKCWGNHVTRLSPIDIENPECANLNQYVGAMRSNGKYITYSKEKRAINCAIQIASYHGLFRNKDGTPKQLREEQKMMLWGIDSMYIAGKKFRHMADKFMNELDFECISDVLLKHESMFRTFMKEYNITAEDGRIWIDDDGYMQTGIKLDKVQEVFPNMDFSLPSGRFIEIASFETPRLRKFDNNLDKNKMDYKRNNPNLFSSVITYNNQMRYSVLSETKNGGEYLFQIRPHRQNV